MTSLTHAIAAFMESPASWFFYRGQPYVWPEPQAVGGETCALGSLAVRVHGYVLGHIEDASFCGSTATIPHLAVEPELTRRGIGPCLARAYARELAARYGINRIVFGETSKAYFEAGYPGFLAKLGATPLPVERWRLSAERPDFEWLQANW